MDLTEGFTRSCDINKTIWIANSLCFVVGI